MGTSLFTLALEHTWQLGPLWNDSPANSLYSTLSIRLEALGVLKDMFDAEGMQLVDGDALDAEQRFP